MTNIAMPSYTLPPLVKLEGNRHNLYHHQVETKKDLMDIVRHLTIVVGLNPTTLSGTRAVFKANDELYLLTADADGNPSGEYFIELSLHKCICDNTSELITWFDLYVAEEDERYDFDDVWEELDNNPPVLRCPRSTFANSFTGSFSPESINAGLNQYVTMLSQIEVFANLLAQLKD